ncbi:lasso RiPP family leader peptide-containing protein [Streptomyces sp. SA15]|nr:lasso RiPP family leader peptide-containing protein [Streptomyces sp. SA15]
MNQETRTEEVYEPPVLAEVGDFADETMGPFGPLPEGNYFRRLL